MSETQYDNPTDKIRKFFSSFPSRNYPKGQILIHAGETPEKILYLVEGSVRQYDISYRGDELVVNVYKEGAFFPMLWALTKNENRYFFSAAENLEVKFAPPEEVVDFLKQHPDVLLDLTTRMYRGLDGVLGRMVQLMAGSAKSRLLYELIIETKRFGTPTDEGIILKINESDLAARAGMSRETVSREIQKLSRDNLVTVTHSKIIIPNLSLLEQKLSRTV